MIHHHITKPLTLKECYRITDYHFEDRGAYTNHTFRFQWNDFVFEALSHYPQQFQIYVPGQPIINLPFHWSRLITLNYAFHSKGMLATIMFDLSNNIDTVLFV